MRLTDEQFQTLSKYETQFRTAVVSKWARIPNNAALHEIHNTLCEISGKRTTINTSCSSCILRLLTEMGNIYFADKAERDKRVQVSEEKIPVQEKVEVKTETKRGRKPKTK